MKIMNSIKTRMLTKTRMLSVYYANQAFIDSKHKTRKFAVCGVILITQEPGRWKQYFFS